MAARSRAMPGPTFTSKAGRRAAGAGRRPADRGVILAVVATLALAGSAAAWLLRDGMPDLEPPKRLYAQPSGRSYAMTPGLDQAVTHPLWDLATIAGIPQSCAITQTWTVVETTRGRDPGTGTYLLLCPRRGVWLLIYDHATGQAGASGPFTNVDAVEELIDPGGSVIWDGPRPSIRLRPAR